MHARAPTPIAYIPRRKGDHAPPRAHAARGVALVLVLMIVGVLAVLMTAISLSVKSQVGRAQAVLARAEAILQTRSAESELAHLMLTRDLVTGEGPEGAARAVPAWNFIGQPYDFLGAEVRIQDVGGLFVSPQRARDAADFALLFEQLLGMARPEAERLARLIEQKMQAPDWIAVQSFRDQDFGELLSPAEQKQLDDYVTLSPGVRFNPLTVPDVLLPVWFAGSELEAIRALRDQNGLDAASYEEIMGPVDEFTVTYPGPQFRVALAATREGVTVARQATWWVDPYGEDPWRRVLQRRGPRTESSEAFDVGR